MEPPRTCAASAFQRYDPSRKGSISPTHARLAYIAATASIPSPHDLDALLGSLRSVPLERFVDVVAPRIKVSFDDAAVEIFRLLDNEDKGYLVTEDLALAMARAAPGLSGSSATAMATIAFRQLDGDGDGRVSYREFYRMLALSSKNVKQ
ncbi:hypothetical protein BJ742DRAFT_443789 [Cladochytrium replicatum]|nr:hypothetical protein BJ742DRAFT_443789 [Cladochytrium replicatum]